MNEIGIEGLKDLSTDVVALLKKVAEAKSDDDKISKAEIIGMLPKVAAVGKDLLKFKELLAEVRDFTTEEGNEFLQHIVSLDVIGDKAEIIALNVIEIIEAEIAIYKNNVVPIIDCFKK